MKKSINDFCTTGCDVLVSGSDYPDFGIVTSEVPFKLVGTFLEKATINTVKLLREKHFGFNLAYSIFNNGGREVILSWHNYLPITETGSPRKLTGVCFQFRFQRSNIELDKEDRKKLLRSEEKFHDAIINAFLESEKIGH